MSRAGLSQLIYIERHGPEALHALINEGNNIYELCSAVFAQLQEGKPEAQRKTLDQFMGSISNERHHALKYDGKQIKKLLRDRHLWLPQLAGHPLYDDGTLPRMLELLTTMLTIMSLSGSSLTPAIISAYVAAAEEWSSIVNGRFKDGFLLHPDGIKLRWVGRPQASGLSLASCSCVFMNLARQNPLRGWQEGAGAGDEAGLGPGSAGDAAAVAQAAPKKPARKGGRPPRVPAPAPAPAGPEAAGAPAAAGGPAAGSPAAGDVWAALARWPIGLEPPEDPREEA